ncbi:phenylalanine--tRNA ligase subunit beta [Thiomicrorhabdus lithotrophica]|uniref:Phenylalanine--tRNA ligase beta subunit n=1 Tax=Thiomicrorhabdus lithotrophica TaxID=2949997 RepID=A0ABY8CCU6_9GAMM|nr:phenylalanine--tRNA ligase subunit beta [Thiomicrorhabdus lithotrophica]WEJ61953.1 phenylalanine--tRNA ligase subunit beta [Thiomicrorhabdus lithotrophica]
MKFSENWLREWTNPQWDTNELSEALSLAGLEVDGAEPVAGAFTNVVVGHVLSIEKHPDADKLNVTQVDVGEDEPVQIVCGAKNVVAGMKACCAKVGAVLPGDFKIKKAKLRGVPSHGMLCGATEIGLPDDGVDGLFVLPDDAPVGMDVRAYLDLNDFTIDVDLTPNRADCFSVLGLARDVFAISDADFTQPFEDKEMSGTTACSQKVVIAEPQSCPKYLGCMVTGFDTQASTPAWMVQKLQRSGLRSLSLVVDITNYVLLELGQPMHAFDMDCLNGDIQVRMANSGEKLTTLDEKEITLSENTLVIADDSGVIALAGIMGGLSTSVTDSTTKIFFECAHFARLAITGKARQYGLHTDSSMRFERGVDPKLPERALNRALQLFTEVAGGEVSAVESIVSDADLPKAAVIDLRRQTIASRLGVEIADEKVEQIFKDLGFSIAATDSGWSVTAPSFRFDMAIEMDLIEEIGRVFGYNNLPETPVMAPMTLNELPESEQSLNALKTGLVQRGYNEVVTYSFVAEDKQQAIAPNLPYVLLKNPISDDMKAMRTTLFPGILQSVAYNQNRQQSRVRLFETGLVFYKNDSDPTGATQIPMFGGAIVGPALASGWDMDSRNADFYDLKGDVETLLSMSHQLDKVRFEPCQNSALHPGQSASITVDGKEIGVMGQLHPQLVKTMGVSGTVFMFQIRQDALMTMAVPSANAISKFPEMQRDLAFVVEESLPVQNLIDAVVSVKSDILQSVDIFDIYRGQGIEDTQKSVAITLRIQHQDRTLQDEEVESLVLEILAAAKQAVNAELR